jgi:hypothetical protein
VLELEMNCPNHVEYGPLLELLRTDTEQMVGELLTFTEAIFPSGKQCDAAKANIKQIAWRHNKAVKNGVDEIMTSTKEKVKEDGK